MIPKRSLVRINCSGQHGIVIINNRTRFGSKYGIMLINNNRRTLFNREEWVNFPTEQMEIADDSDLTVIERARPFRGNMPNRIRGIIPENNTRIPVGSLVRMTERGLTGQHGIIMTNTRSDLYPYGISLINQDRTPIFTPSSSQAESWITFPCQYATLCNEREFGLIERRRR